MRRLARTALLALALLAVGCADDPADATDDDRVVSAETVDYFPVSGVFDLDLLFVVDNSSSMADEQALLERNFPRFMNVLETVEGGLDSVHIGVISTDDSAFRGARCPQLNGNAFIKDVEDERGDRVRNYSGTLQEAFTCAALVGTGGSDWSRPLEMARAALEPSGPNADFVRDGAFLGLVFITDEDDLSSGDVASYVDFFRGLKDDPTDVIVSGIMQPARRLQRFLSGFPQRNTLQRIDEEDLSGGLIQLAERYGPYYRSRCLNGNIQTEPLDCSVSDVDGLFTDNPVEEVMAACDNPASPLDSSQLPCWVISEDASECADFPTRLAFDVYPLRRRIRGDVTTVVRCAVVTPTSEP